MTRMMETLESRQMFSVAIAEPTELPADTSAYVDASASTEDVMARKRSSPVLMRACATGEHLKSAILTT